MNFHEGEFDAILDKATLDSILVKNLSYFSADRIQQLMQAKLFQKSTVF